jgi:uroporphyrinogen-III synthase
VVLSSPQAASVFLDYWANNGKPGVKVATVGKGSSKPLVSAGIQPCFEPSDSTAETFSKELPSTLGKRILYPTSSLAENTMQRGLESRGFQVTRLNTYETVEAAWSSEELADARDVDIVAFASPSAVRTWQNRCGTSYVAVTIGPTTAKAAEKFKEVISPKESKGIQAWADLIVKTVDEFDSGVC